VKPSRPRSEAATAKAWERAATAFESAIQHDSAAGGGATITDTTIKSRVYLGLIALHQAQYEAAASQFKIVSSMAPSMPHPYLGLAHATAAIGGDDAVAKAIELTNQASKLAAAAGLKLPQAEAARSAWERNTGGTKPGGPFDLGAPQHFFNTQIN
jgi:hypothetical protein